MKKKLIVILALCSLVTFSFVGCRNSPATSSEMNLNGTVSGAVSSVESGGKELGSKIGGVVSEVVSDVVSAVTPSK